MRHYTLPPRGRQDGLFSRCTLPPFHPPSPGSARTDPFSPGRRQDGLFSRCTRNLVPYIFLFLLLILTFAPLVLTFAQETPAGAAVEYRDVPGMGSRNLIWIIAQQHLLLAGFVLGVPIFAWVCEIVGVLTKGSRCVKMAKEFKQ